MRTVLAVSLVSVLAAAGLAACQKQVEAPLDKGVCWHAIPQEGGEMKFNRLAANVPNIETCAATLEGMRLRFARLGKSETQTIGAYQSNFIFLQPEGVLVGRTLTSARYVALVRTGDGRLATPMSMPLVAPGPPPSPAQ